MQRQRQQAAMGRAAARSHGACRVPHSRADRLACWPRWDPRPQATIPLARPLAHHGLPWSPLKTHLPHLPSAPQIGASSAMAGRFVLGWVKDRGDAALWQCSWVTPARAPGKVCIRIPSGSPGHWALLVHLHTPASHTLPAGQVSPHPPLRAGEAAGGGVSGRRPGPARDGWPVHSSTLVRPAGRRWPLVRSSRQCKLTSWTHRRSGR